MILIILVALWLAGFFRKFRFDPIYPPTGQVTSTQENTVDVKGQSTKSSERAGSTGR